ncbi:hypothetical protein [Salidesulfovibrio brasiliensis]|uniref:hypothetical protein n=1 Tax=Salidesulfovibrio brasiliensis TaxID=221711 RepID=UPI0006CFDDF1|nr:hypothetical protein [Salidesulfovibrio brasiliensis]
MCGSTGSTSWLDTLGKAATAASAVGSAASTGMALFGKDPEVETPGEAKAPGPDDPKVQAKAKAQRQRLLSRRGKDSTHLTFGKDASARPEVVKTVFGGW